MSAAVTGAIIETLAIFGLVVLVGVILLRELAPKAFEVRLSYRSLVLLVAAFVLVVLLVSLWTLAA